MFTERQLTDKRFLEELRAEAQDIMSEDRFREAYDLSKFLSNSLDSVKNFKVRNYNLYVEYQELISRLRWVGLPIMTQEMVANMFQHNFMSVFEIPDYDIRAKLKTVLLGIVILDDRDKFKKSLRDALRKNEEKLTSQKLVIDNLKADPTVGNWLADYNRALGTGQVEGLARTEYLVNSKNIKNLNEEEKKRVRFLFDLYERLKLSSQTFEGLENEIPLDEEGAKGVIKEGVFESYTTTDRQKQIMQMAEDFLRERRKIYGKKPSPLIKSEVKKSLTRQASEAEKNLAELRELAATFPPGSLERKAVEEEMERVTRNS